MLQQRGGIDFEKFVISKQAFHIKEGQLALDISLHHYKQCLHTSLFHSNILVLPV